MLRKPFFGLALLLVPLLSYCEAIEPLYVRVFGRAAHQIRPSPPSGAGAATNENTIFAYTNKAGRTVYVDRIDKVPAALRAQSARVALSKVSLNSELARDLDKRVLEEHQALARSSYCAETTFRAAQPWWREVWHTHGYWMVLASVLLLLVLVTPLAMRSVDPPAWARFLGFAIPSLLVVGLVTHGMVQAQRARENVQLAANLCDPKRISSSSPSSTRSRIQVVQKLRQIIRASEKHREDVIQDAFKDSRFIAPLPNDG
ncbi:MAG: hypothetical protein H6714_10725 [Myxococcales bacterium]|nr:hypothetical protein [Myxococcales bacterium]